MSEINQLFEGVFGEQTDEIRLAALTKLFGKEKMETVLTYFLVNPPHPPKDGQRRNPYGLLYKVCSEWINK